MGSEDQHGQPIGFTESLVSSKGAKNFSIYSKKLSGVLLVAVGIYFGLTNMQ